MELSSDLSFRTLVASLTGQAAEYARLRQGECKVRRATAGNRARITSQCYWRAGGHMGAVRIACRLCEREGTRTDEPTEPFHEWSRVDCPGGPEAHYYASFRALQKLEQTYRDGNHQLLHSIARTVQQHRNAGRVARIGVDQQGGFSIEGRQ